MPTLPPPGQFRLDPGRIDYLGPATPARATRLFKALSDPDLPYGSAPDPRMVLERTPGFRITVYASPDDKALATSGWLFGSIFRLGRLDRAMLTPEQIE
jgi:hypothetical protein